MTRHVDMGVSTNKVRLSPTLLFIAPYLVALYKEQSHAIKAKTVHAKLKRVSVSGIPSISPLWPIPESKNPISALVIRASWQFHLCLMGTSSTPIFDSKSVRNLSLSIWR